MTQGTIDYCGLNVNYAFYPGEPETMWTLGEPGNPGTGDSFEILDVTDEEGNEVELTAAEENEVEQLIYKAHEN